MTISLIILIDLCLIFAVSRCRRTYKTSYYAPVSRWYCMTDKDRGLLERATRRAAIAEKFAERAFNMASTANLGVVALQKALAIPRPLTASQVKANKVAKQNVDSLFTTNGGWDFMKPYLSDEDLEVVAKIEEDQKKAMAEE